MYLIRQRWNVKPFQMTGHTLDSPTPNHICLSVFYSCSVISPLMELWSAFLVVTAPGACSVKRKGSAWDYSMMILLVCLLERPQFSQNRTSGFWADSELSKSLLRTSANLLLFNWCSCSSMIPRLIQHITNSLITVFYDIWHSLAKKNHVLTCLITVILSRICIIFKGREVRLLPLYL